MHAKKVIPTNSNFTMSEHEDVVNGHFFTHI